MHREQVEYVSDVSLAISRQAYQAVGPLDERILARCLRTRADIDWCNRVRNAGYHVVYAPKSRLIRRTAARADAGTSASGDTNADDGPGDFSFHRNRFRFLLKHWSLHRLVDDFMPAEQRWLGASRSAPPSIQRRSASRLPPATCTSGRDRRRPRRSVPHRLRGTPRSCRRTAQPAHPIPGIR